LLSLGRIEEKSKGLFIIPKALEKIQDLNWTLTIAGDGPDRVELERRLSRSMEKVKFVGQIAPEEVPDCFKTHDVFLFPSRYEGFGITLIEALAAGCTPIASLITGVTDDIVLDQDRGLIIPQGNFQALARAIRFLYENPSIRSKMQKKGIAWASDNVAIDKVCYKYFELLQSKIKNQKSSPKAIDSWRIPNGMRPGFRTFLPEPIKSKLREWREKLHTFTVHQYNNN
jgi:glycosyltransferase involved in cell wall biosynthesis